MFSQTELLHRKVLSASCFEQTKTVLVEKSRIVLCDFSFQTVVSELKITAPKM